MEAKEALEVLAELLSARAAHFRKRERFGFALAEGERFVLDPTGAVTLAATWSDELSVRIFTNARTLADMVAGAFDPSAPQAGQLFLFEGDRNALAQLGAALAEGSSAVGIRARDP